MRMDGMNSESCCSYTSLAQVFHWKCLQTHRVIMKVVLLHLPDPPNPGRIRNLFTVYEGNNGILAVRIYRYHTKTQCVLLSESQWRECQRHMIFRKKVLQTFVQKMPPIRSSCSDLALGQWPSCAPFLRSLEWLCRHPLCVRLHPLRQYIPALAAESSFHPMPPGPLRFSVDPI